MPLISKSVRGRDSPVIYGIVPLTGGIHRVSPKRIMRNEAPGKVLLSGYRRNTEDRSHREVHLPGGKLYRYGVRLERALEDVPVPEHDSGPLHTVRDED